MAIKDRLSRWKHRKSTSSTSSSGRSSDGRPHTFSTMPAPLAAPSLTLHASMKPSRKTHWRDNHATVPLVRKHPYSNSNSNNKRKAAAGAASRRLHPSERPLTELNMRHQELLGTFTMKFGRRARSEGVVGPMGECDWEDISPRNSVVAERFLEVAMDVDSAFGGDEEEERKASDGGEGERGYDDDDDDGEEKQEEEEEEVAAAVVVVKAPMVTRGRVAPESVLPRVRAPPPARKGATVAGLASFFENMS